MTQSKFEIVERTPEERERRRIEWVEQDAGKLEEEIQRLSSTPVAPSRMGRPPTVLPPEIARLVLDDIEQGASIRAVSRKYARFSRTWLLKALADGSLAAMCKP